MSEQASLFEDAVPSAPRWAVELVAGQLAQIVTGGQSKVSARQRAKLEALAVESIAVARRALA